MVVGVVIFFFFRKVPSFAHELDFVMKNSQAGGNLRQQLTVVVSLPDIFALALESGHSDLLPVILGTQLLQSL